MRKIFPALLLLSLLAVLVVPLAISAQVPPKEIKECTMRHTLTGAEWTDLGINCPDKTVKCDFTNPGDYTCGVCCLMDTVYTVTDWVFVLVVILAIIFVLAGAFYILTAGGTPERVTTGRMFIVWAVVGVLIALLAKAIPTIVKNVLGM